jgi:alkylhydroperoxidase/carboxymuconolactone decarboxylase family protein YurZ
MNTTVSTSFQAFLKEAPKHSSAWGEAVDQLKQASALDAKTAALAYLSVLAASGLDSGLAFHVKQDKAGGAKRDEVISALLIGLPAVGLKVLSGLPAALTAYDNDSM